METKQKLEILRKLDTKSLIDKIHQYEDDIETAMRDDASFKDLNYEYLASGTNDCQAIKIILAELLAQAPETTEVEKPLTKVEKSTWLKEQLKLNSDFSGSVDDAPKTAIVVKNLTENDKKAWLEQQRKENDELSGAINRQKNTAFNADNNGITIEMAKKRLESAKAVLKLKTEQIAFLGSE